MLEAGKVKTGQNSTFTENLLTNPDMSIIIDVVGAKQQQVGEADKPRSGIHLF